MEYYHGVKVEVICTKSVLPQSEDPDLEDDQAGLTLRRYVEALTGTSFTVRVTLADDYALKSGELVKVNAVFDGGINWRKFIGRRPESQEPRSVLCTGVTALCPSTDIWQRGDLCFGTLETTEEQVQSKVPAEKVQKLGTIRVTAQRVVRDGYRDRKVTSHSMDRVSEIPEKTLKGKVLSNTVEYSNRRPAERLSRQKMVTKPIEGSDGQLLTFEILYRSRRTLQSLGCIPRSPSPEMSQNSSRNRNLDKDAKILYLEARMALFERNTNIKSDPTSAIAALKHEREDVESPRKKPRKSDSIGFVDLTGD